MKLKREMIAFQSRSRPKFVISQVFWQLLHHSILVFFCNIPIAVQADDAAVAKYQFEYKFWKGAPLNLLGLVQ